METTYTAGRGTPADFSDNKITSMRRTSSAKCSATTLRFAPLTLAELPLVNRILQQSPSRTCDYSIGGIYMWIEYFGYKVCFVGDTLFIKGVSESDPTVTAFMMPVGEMDDARAVRLIRDYCRSLDLLPVLSAVPEDRMEALTAICPDARCESLDMWSDYLYDIDALASLRGKAYNKKRNHVNRFMSDNPDMFFEPLTTELLPEVILYFEGMCMRERSEPDPSALGTAAYERRQTMEVLNNYSSYPFTGAVLRAQSGEIASFCIGEPIGDTLFVHIEKSRHDIAGAGETINMLYAREMKDKFPGLRFVNREDDAGDPGLRKAKLSYRPCSILQKYNVYL